MRRSSILLGVLALVLVAAISVYATESSTWGRLKEAFGSDVAAPAAKTAGFDEFGYNYQARIFSGLADGVDRNLDGTVWGDPTYANDYLVMKWSTAWDEAKYGGGEWTADAWVNNEWNGNVPGGSGETWVYKIIWVGPELEDSPYWREGGYPIWGQFEVIMSHGTVDGEHIWDTLANPAGYGSN